MFVGEGFAQRRKRGKGAKRYPFPRAFFAPLPPFAPLREKYFFARGAPSQIGAPFGQTTVIPVLPLTVWATMMLDCSGRLIQEETKSPCLVTSFAGGNLKRASCRESKDPGSSPVSRMSPGKHSSQLTNAFPKVNLYVRTGRLVHCSNRTSALLRHLVSHAKPTVFVHLA